MNQIYHAALTVVGSDQPGIISRLTSIFHRHGANLEDITMTILEGQFAMILLASYKNPQARQKILSDLQKGSRVMNLSINWRDIKGKLKRGESHLKKSYSYLITAVGNDKTGIIHEISESLYRSGANITDLRSRLIGEKGKPIYSVLMETDIPKSVSLIKLRKIVTKLTKSLDIEISAKPIETITY